MLENEYCIWKFTRQLRTMLHLIGEQLDFKQQIMFGKQQEYLAEFVDWAGVAFFGREKLLENGQPVRCPKSCDGVFAVIDTASKTGTDHDATAATFFALDGSRRAPLLILDWDIAQIEGALLETWLPMVFDRLEELSRLCSARHGSLGVWIQDKNSGTILLQQAIRSQWPLIRN